MSDDPYKEGYHAFQQGKGYRQNPYLRFSQSWQPSRWLQGWNAADRARDRQKALKEEEETRMSDDPYTEGRRAFDQGMGMAENPYRHYGDPGSYNEEEWDIGWSEADRERLRRQVEEDERRATRAAVKGAGWVLRQIRRVQDG